MSRLQARSTRPAPPFPYTPHSLSNKPAPRAPAKKAPAKRASAKDDGVAEKPAATEAKPEAVEAAAKPAATEAKPAATEAATAADAAKPAAEYSAGHAAAPRSPDTFFPFWIRSSRHPSHTPRPAHATPTPHTPGNPRLAQPIPRP